MAHIARLYLPGRLVPGPITLDVEQSRRLAAVMRLREGDEFRLFAGDGREWSATAATVAKGALRAVVGEVARQEPQPPVTVELWVALVRPNRFDWAIEKAIEAGADVIRPFTSEYTARGDFASNAKQQRWQRIVVEAAEQSGRLWVPVIEPPATLDALLARPRGPVVLGDPAGMPWREAAALLPPAGQIAVVVGPEGGFSPAELARAKAAGALATRFGPHILRTETAAVVATALVRSSG